LTTRLLCAYPERLNDMFQRTLLIPSVIWRNTFQMFTVPSIVSSCSSFWNSNNYQRHLRNSLFDLAHRANFAPVSVGAIFHPFVLEKYRQRTFSKTSAFQTSPEIEYDINVYLNSSLSVSSFE
jgi:hypothetical protein